jgi:hypothetical protein
MASGFRVRGAPYDIRLGSVFSPLKLVLFLYVPLLLLYVGTGTQVFASDFGSVKALSWTGFSYFGLAVLLFAAGAKIGADGTGRKAVRGRPRPGRRELTRDQRRSLAVLLEAALLTSIGAYLLWFSLGVVRAGGPAKLIEAWRNDPHLVKDVYLATVPGITTLTQLAVAAIPLVLAFGLFRRGTVMPVLVVLVVALALVRSFLFNERLALLEVLVPGIVVLAAPRRVTIPRIAAYAGIFVATVVTFFAVTELRRTYVYTHQFSVSHATARFFGYYLTSVNNGMVVAERYRGQTPFYSTGGILWSFPVAGDLRVEHLPSIGTISLKYSDLFGVDPPEFWPSAFSREGLNYEFNTFSTPGYLAADLAWLGLLAVFLLGLVSGRLYRWSSDDDLSLAFYAVWVVGLLEFMRILYFTNSRLLPAYIVFMGAFLVVRRHSPSLPAALASRQTQLAARGSVE